jgi:hypothetical protein
MKYLLVLALLVSSSLAQDHGHLNVGANGTSLTFDNGVTFEDPYVKTLLFTNTGKYANVYNGNITLTALHSRDAFGDLDRAAPKPGSFVVAEIVSVDGPTGGAFQFWETNSTSAPAVSVPTGTTNAGFRFEVSEAALGAGQSDGDAFGHIHGRRFTATAPGLYTIGFRAYDLSTNGPNGGPLQTPSGAQLINFQAGVVLTQIEPDVSHVHITFGAMAGFSWQLQFTDSLSEPHWQDTNSPLVGDDTLQEIQDHHAVTGNRFFRVVGTQLPP